MKNYLLTSFLCLSTLFCGAQESTWLSDLISIKDFRADFELLTKVLEESHPGINFYTPEDELYFMEQKMRNAERVITKQEAFARYAYFINEIKDGHTYISPGRALEEQVIRDGLFFPFTLRFIKESAYVDLNFVEGIDIPKGSEILAIDGMPIEQCLEQLLPYITNDGFNNKAKYAGLEGQFWWFYALHFGLREKHHMAYLHPVSHKRMAVSVPAVSYLERQHVLSLVYDYGLSAEEHAVVSYDIDENVGYLRVSKFHGISRYKYGRLLSEAFGTFQDAHVDALIIDVRQNGGGKEGFENMLMAHLDHDVKVKYDEVRLGAPRSSHYSNLDQSVFRRFEDHIYRLVEFRKSDDGKWERRKRFERTWREPRYKYHGMAYVLIDGEVFSGASEFAAMANDYGRRCILIGEETAGGYQCNNSGYFYKLKLPKTGFEVEIPRIHFDLNVCDQLNEGGVRPDIQVTSSYSDFVSGIDTQMRFTMNLIKQGIVMEE